MSNILRIVLLLKFGGTYFDSDVISIRQLPIDKQGYEIDRGFFNFFKLEYLKAHLYLKSEETAAIGSSPEPISVIAVSPSERLHLNICCTGFWSQGRAKLGAFPRCCGAEKLAT